MNLPWTNPYEERRRKDVLREIGQGNANAVAGIYEWNLERFEFSTLGV